MRSGRLRQIIDFIEPDTVRDSHGQPIPTFTTIDREVPASVTAVAGGERVRGKTMSSIATSLIVTRFREDITDLIRIIFEERELEIVRVYDPDGKRHDLFIETKEEV